MNIIAAEYIHRLRQAIKNIDERSSVSAWVSSYTRLKGEPWSFKDHEFQKEIMDCGSLHVSVIKPAQVGMSELLMRFSLAYLALHSETTIIYVLPSAKFAYKFSKSRYDPAIESSPRVKNLIMSGNDSAELKRFVNGSVLLMAGSRGASQAISTPARALVIDEVDFCDQVTLAKFSSRLQHNKDGGMRRHFSTPTVEGFGISLHYDHSDQREYQYKCPKCSEEFAPDFFRDVVIPGYDDRLAKLEKEDILNPDYDVSGSYVACMRCKNKLNLLELHGRWVNKFENEKAGFKVTPFCLPAYRSPAVVVNSIMEYKAKADWVNFSVGLPYSDHSTSVTEDALNKNSNLSPVMPDNIGSGNSVADGTIMGVDVGKTSWLLIGKKVGTDIHVIYGERVKIGESGDGLENRINELMDMYNCVKLVIDSAPFTDTVLRVIASHMDGTVFACYYRRFMTSQNLEGISVDEKKATIGVDRTKSFDNMVKTINRGKIKFARFPEITTVSRHLRNIKRIEHYTDDETKVASWISTGDGDHFAHALQYLLQADHLLENHQNSFVPCLPGVTGVNLWTPDNNLVGQMHDSRRETRMLAVERARLSLNKGRYGLSKTRANHGRI